ncbi:uncharacterized protein LOC113515561 [Galleria mellonella]|uniref:Uncharacterized protein LOC113515561 n=1 Tax=Galleria mellonella TaxID=7137 RepID=A0A6J1WLG8_GALME|nr:uncharacterized protein LOC113515561 [Galleria mellonella]XP_026755618.2 uncharacterized protein LOC113515561 [Galleria mellonella]
MAGNKINTKGKSRDDKNKLNKVISQGNEENEEIDFSILRKPIYTSVTGLAQARKIFDCATEELKNLLSSECDLLYECKVCRNIFRSLVNFISHKRVYCKETFNSSQHSHFINPTSTANEILKIKRLEEGYQQSLEEKIGSENNDMEIDEFEDRIPLTKDLTTIMEKITKNKGISSNKSEQNIVLQKIAGSSVAVFQSVDYSEEKQFDKMKAQVNELDDILSRDKAVLQKDGKFKTQTSVPTDTDNVIQISDDEDTEATGILKCKICDQQFSTQKTLKFHMKYKHVESRLVYPCPDCLEIFSTSWSVYRHLFKVHRKTAAQIRKLRESIQAKAFRMNNPPAFYEKRKNMKPTQVQKITEEERVDQENQAWMDNMEGEGETPRCFGCGRTFERRAALAAHTHTCQPRSRVLAPAHPARRAPETKKIEIQIRKDYNKGPPQPSALNMPMKTGDANETKVSSEDQSPIKTIKSEENFTSVQQKDLVETTPTKMGDNQNSDNKSSEDAEKNKPLLVSKLPKLPFAHQPEKSNLTAFKQKIQPDIDTLKNLCKRCDIQHNNTEELYNHMAAHYKWMRYACKLCNFKNYEFEKLPEHVKIVHKLKGDTDFYFSTVKAIDGAEALELSELVEELNDNNESPDSRRPSRCSSDSSRLSDDSSSSSTRVEAGSRKRKINQSRNVSKKKKETVINDDDDELKGEVPIETSLVENDSSTTVKTFEENSSDMDDLDEKIAKKQIEQTLSVASRRPIRKKTKPKNEDFEYDLSNLLKMEAQGYRDSQTVSNTKSIQTKKRTMQENQNYYDNVNKDCCGALVMLSKKAVGKASAHMKTTNFSVSVQKETKSSNIFVRPMLPKTISKCDKTSPKKDVDNLKELPSPNKEVKNNKNIIDDCIKTNIIEDKTTANSETNEIETPTKEASDNSKSNKDEKPTNSGLCETIKTNLNIPAVVPIKFRRQSLEVIKNPLINKNITDFTKAGMKTKILVIKPINRNKDGIKTASTPIKFQNFQTIKLKDPSKNSAVNETKSSDQVVVVKVPKEKNDQINSHENFSMKDICDKEQVESKTDANVDVVVSNDNMGIPCKNKIVSNDISR